MVFNIASGVAISIREIIEKICILTNAGKPQFSKIPSRIGENSALYANIEKAKNVYTIEANFKWNDLGTWFSLFTVLTKNNDSSHHEGDVISLQSANNLVINSISQTATGPNTVTGVAPPPTTGAPTEVTLVPPGNCIKMRYVPGGPSCASS